MRARTRWGGGFQDAAISTADARAAAPALLEVLGIGSLDPEEPVPPEAIEVPAPRLHCPRHLRGICGEDDGARLGHAYGQSYLDTVRALRGVYEHVPDAVARPHDGREEATSR
jgi:alkyldihydroxyacetonephosphate synthase